MFLLDYVVILKLWGCSVRTEVICSKNPNLKIGKIYRGLDSGPWKYGPLPNQCFMVISKSTAEAWIECNVAWGGPRDHFEMLVDINGPWFYYEIQTD